MTLLGWMHRKLRQNSIEPVKRVMCGNHCTCLSAHPQLDEQQYYPEPNYHAAHSRQTGRYHKSSVGHKANRSKEVFEEETSPMVHEFFHGFLAIGTLGTEPLIMEPTTPKLAMSFENVTEKEREVTESELKLINDQLEKFLESEAKEIGKTSPERSSHASISTLSSKKIEDIDAEEHGNMVSCPLQEYLFGSSLELPDSPEEVKREKTTLWELFEKNSKGYKHNAEKIDEGVVEADGIHFMRKILKKIRFSSRKCTASYGRNGTNSGSAKRKVPKFLRSFHRKIHPETGEVEARRGQKYETDNTSRNGSYHNEDVKNNENTTLLHTTTSTKETAGFKMSASLNNNHPTRNGEYWIKTDADYLVLEL